MNRSDAPPASTVNKITWSRYVTLDSLISLPALAGRASQALMLPPCIWAIAYVRKKNPMVPLKLDRCIISSSSRFAIEILRQQVVPPLLRCSVACILPICQDVGIPIVRCAVRRGIPLDDNLYLTKPQLTARRLLALTAAVDREFCPFRWSGLFCSYAATFVCRALARQGRRERSFIH